MGTPGENEEIVRRLNTIWDGNLDIVDELVAEDFINHNPLVPDTPPGREGFKRNVSAIKSAFPDIDFMLEDIITEGDKVVFRAVGQGTHDGELMGIAPTGQGVALSGIVIFRIENGQVAERWAQFDTLGLLQQLGVVPPPDEMVAHGA